MICNLADFFRCFRTLIQLQVKQPAHVNGIWVKRASDRPMFIGAGGRRLPSMRVGTEPANQRTPASAIRCVTRRNVDINCLEVDVFRF